MLTNVLNLTVAANKYVQTLWDLLTVPVLPVIVNLLQHASKVCQMCGILFELKSRCKILNGRDLEIK